MTAATAISPSVKDCAGLAALLPTNVFFSGNSTYTSQETSYYSETEAELTPTCIVQPGSTQDVATIINFLRISPYAGQTLVAVRSGGHTPWAGAANIHDGITIDMSRLNATTLDASKTVASVEVGAWWGSVYSTLATQGLAIMGGRVSNVGVGGLVLGGTSDKIRQCLEIFSLTSSWPLGGVSYFSDEKGWVCDSVNNYKMVLSSGDIIQVNATSYPDLSVALKGGTTISVLSLDSTFQPLLKAKCMAALSTTMQLQSTLLTRPSPNLLPIRMEMKKHQSRPQLASP
jgi:FAD/FMN-containing dehydrogenase